MRLQNRLLIVDDEPGIRAFFRDVASELDFIVADAADGVDFDRLYDTFQPTVILLDLTLPGTDGVELLRELASKKCRAAIILASGRDRRVLATAQRVGDSLQLDMRPPLQKPVDIVALEQALRSAGPSTTAPAALAKNDGANEATISAEQLEQAITREELVVHYQPKVCLQSGEVYPIIGSEALVRWNHPWRGLVSPAEFIPLAEQSGLIGPLTDFVLRAAVHQLKTWSKAKKARPVSINLSPVQLTDLTLPDQIASLLDTARLERSLLVVEVTEEAAMADIEKATDILTRLRLKDIAVSLDDFGSGFSSLVEIYRMPLSELKFDRSLIVDLDTNEDARTVVRALVALAKTLGISVCAEGVETWETVSFLKAIGCEKAQGYVLSKPLPADDFINEKWFSKSDANDAGQKRPVTA
ncbi:MAG: EAL domain-containing response regulator [Roseibium sp.]|nr:EAL domain-containing response regulator [Roseibium sp.]